MLLIHALLPFLMLGVFLTSAFTNTGSIFSPSSLFLFTTYSLLQAVIQLFQERALLLIISASGLESSLHEHYFLSCFQF